MHFKSLSLKAGFIAVIILMGVSLQTCTKEHLPEAPICYSEEVYPIILSNCTYSGCHNPFDLEQGLDLTTYEGILSQVEPGNYSGSELYKAIVADYGEIMPPPPHEPLSVDQITLIARWIQDGAVNTSNCQASCDTSSATYNARVVPILETFCIGCHSGSIPQGNIDLTTYAHVKAQVDKGAFLGSIKHEVGFSEMPKNAPSLSDCKIKIISKWVEEGALNN